MLCRKQKDKKSGLGSVRIGFHGYKLTLSSFFESQEARVLERLLQVLRHLWLVQEEVLPEGA